MTVFARLKALRAFEKKHFPYLRTLEDYDLVREIGYHQENGGRLTMKQLYLLDVASVATVQRRLRRLRQLGVVQQVRSDKDGRALEIQVTPRIVKSFARYLELLRGGEARD
ncbi:MAG: hypothetical protein JO035_13455 [Betaproteobacteria bacterium]|nr:hypothetical protein [Betaproteobacteria bacterium]